MLSESFLGHSLRDYCRPGPIPVLTGLTAWPSQLWVRVPPYSQVNAGIGDRFHTKSIHSSITSVIRARRPCKRYAGSRVSTPEDRSGTWMSRVIFTNTEPGGAVSSNGYFGTTGIERVSNGHAPCCVCASPPPIWFVANDEHVLRRSLHNLLRL